MRTQRAALGAIGTVLFVGAGSASVAFACTPQAQVSVPVEAAAPGATVQVEGRSIPSGSPVEIRWDGVRGSVLGVVTPDKGAFSLPVQIPALTPAGVYALTVVAPEGAVGRTALEVGEPGSLRSPDASQPWSSGTSGPSTAASPGPSPVGATLMAVGLVGLFAGSTVAVARRRRTLVKQ